MDKLIMRVDDIHHIISEMVGGNLYPHEDVVTFGLKSATVKKIVLCWMADVNALQYAARVGANLVIAHESAFFPYNVGKNGNAPEFMTWPTNYNRVKLLVENGISLIRMHAPMDNHCILDEFVKALGLENPAENWMPKGQEFRLNVFDIAPVAYGDFIARIKTALNLQTLRASAGDLNRLVQRVGIPWGGIGLHTNIAIIQQFVEKECDVLITGETDNYGIRFAMDAGIEMIETGHEISENFGIRRFAAELAERLPGIPTEFYENQSPFIFM